MVSNLIYIELEVILHLVSHKWLEIKIKPKNFTILAKFSYITSNATQSCWNFISPLFYAMMGSFGCGDYWYYYWILSDLSCVFLLLSIIICNFLILKILLHHLKMLHYCFVSHISKDTNDCRHFIWLPLILGILALMWTNQAVTKMISTMCEV